MNLFRRIYFIDMDVFTAFMYAENIIFTSFLKSEKFTRQLAKTYQWKTSQYPLPFLVHPK